MITVTVYRAPQRDAHGDAVDADGNPVGADGALVGQLDLIMGGQSVAPVNTRGDVVSTEGQVGAPTDAAIVLEHGDVLVTEDGQRLKVSGPALWGTPNSLTGTPARYRWHEVVSLYN